MTVQTARPPRPRQPGGLNLPDRQERPDCTAPSWLKAIIICLLLTLARLSWPMARLAGRIILAVWPGMRGA